MIVYHELISAKNILVNFYKKIFGNSGCLRNYMYKLKEGMFIVNCMYSSKVVWNSKFLYVSIEAFILVDDRVGPCIFSSSTGITFIDELWTLLFTTQQSIYKEHVFWKYETSHKRMPQMYRTPHSVGCPWCCLDLITLNN